MKLWLLPFLTANLLLFRAITFLHHTVPDFTDNGASNIIKYGNDYYATSETNYICKIDPVTLETQDKVKFYCRSRTLLHVESAV